MPSAVCRPVTDNHPSRLVIEVFFDFICPWCWIGTRHLNSALREFAVLRPHVSTKLRWRSYALLPDTPAEGVPYQAFYLSRLGGPTAVALRRAQVQRAGHMAGIDFDFARINVLPNTLAAHNLLARLTRRRPAFPTARFIERVFNAYFFEGEDIGNPIVLERLALEYGADPDALAAHFADERQRPRPQRQREPSLGVAASGVPYFVFNKAESISGAHPPGAMLNAMLRSVRARA